MDMSANRNHYTKYGLHMNKRGKDWLTRRIADTIKKLFANQKLAPLSLNGK